MLMTVRVANRMHDVRDRYDMIPSEFNDYTGEVVKRPSWVSDDLFCLSTDDPRWKFRIIEKDRVICAWLYD
jgi:hypothetical protein